jgi:hypothetical protein
MKRHTQAIPKFGPPKFNQLKMNIIDTVPFANEKINSQNE